MNSIKNTEGVGKKIVEALKQQSDVEIVPVMEEVTSEPETFGTSEFKTEPDMTTESYSASQTPYEEINNSLNSSFNNSSNSMIDNAFNNTMMNFRTGNQDMNLSAVDDMDLPANVAVLRQLITKIPAGVSKQTGALIIKQTMEALGISMTNVLQEAQQVQDNLTQSVKDCQNNVLEYKKQINILESQAQKYQKQFAAINDIISLFIQTN